MTFNTRKAGMDDLEILTAFTLKEAQEAEGIKLREEIVRNGIEECLSSPDIATYWVLLSEPDKVIGSASLIRERSDWHGGDYGWVQSMYILPEFRGKNLMKLLLSAIEKQANVEKLHDLRLYVHKDNSRAIKAYRKNGFKNTPYKIFSMRLDIKCD
jgi:GNAT superfamily N-acetyltransferase